MADFKGQKKGSPMSETWGFFFGGSEHGPESSCQISAYYQFFPGFNVFRRISTGLECSLRIKRANIHANEIKLAP